MTPPDSSNPAKDSVEPAPTTEAVKPGVNAVPSAEVVEADVKPVPPAVIVKPVKPQEVTLLTAEDIRAFHEGTHGHLYEKLGAHLMTVDGVAGTYFAVWAPNARQVAVIGDFNGWDKSANPLHASGQAGIWEGFIAGALQEDHYKYFITSSASGHVPDKADPVAFRNEEPPKTASVIWDLHHKWTDQIWMEQRIRRNALDKPIAIYELHLGSWMRVPEESNRWLTYREVAGKLAEYVQQMGFTHVELLPVMEHPFYGSWGYQPTGYFAATSRYGTPQDLMYMIDLLHQNDIGVILDWVPFHFPDDLHALTLFDGTDLYAHPDRRRGYHPTWRSALFDYERPEVRSFLLSSALLWLEKYHFDGLRVDAVSYMLYHNYYRKQGEWLPNNQGGRENLEAIAFLRQLNDMVHDRYPSALMVAEEASTWPGVSRPPAEGGLGFDFKWDMGWMNDTLQFMHLDGHRRNNQLKKLTFRMLYAFSENFLLPLSHDEVVHCKGSLWQKMWGNNWEKFAGLRLLYGYTYAQPGKKLLFMSDEFAQIREWNHDHSLDWDLLNHATHAGVQRCVQDLNRLYRTLPALHEIDGEPAGFEWIACDDTTNGVFSFLRKARSTDDLVLVVCNFSPQARYNYRVGVPRSGFWQETFNSDARTYGGGGLGNYGGFDADAVASNWRPYSLNLTLPPLSTMFFKSQAEASKSED